MPAEFCKGDFVVEHDGFIAPSFGVVIGSELTNDGEALLEVRSPSGVFYMFASRCRHYEEWLNVS